MGASDGGCFLRKKHGGTEMAAACNSEVAAHRREQDGLPFTRALPRRHRSERTRAAAGRQHNFTPDAVLGPLASALGGCAWIIRQQPQILSRPVREYGRRTSPLQTPRRIHRSVDKAEWGPSV